MLNRWLSGTEERARDIQRTLATFDGAPLLRDDFAPILTSFQQLSQQLGLLQERRSDPAAEAALERHFAVPSNIAELDVALIPHILSTRLDKEQEDEDLVARRSAKAAWVLFTRPKTPSSSAPSR